MLSSAAHFLQDQQVPFHTALLNEDEHTVSTLNVYLHRSTNNILTPQSFLNSLESTPLLSLNQGYNYYHSCFESEVEGRLNPRNNDHYHWRSIIHSRLFSSDSYRTISSWSLALLDTSKRKDLLNRWIEESRSQSQNFYDMMKNEYSATTSKFPKPLVDATLERLTLAAKETAALFTAFFLHTIFITDKDKDGVADLLEQKITGTPWNSAKRELKVTVNKISTRTYELTISLRDDRAALGGKINIKWNGKTVQTIDVQWQSKDILVAYEDIPLCYVKTTTLVFTSICRFTVPSTQNYGLLSVTATFTEQCYNWQSWTTDTFTYELFFASNYFTVSTATLHYSYYIELSKTGSTLV